MKRQTISRIAAAVVTMSLVTVGTTIAPFPFASGLLGATVSAEEAETVVNETPETVAEETAQTETESAEDTVNPDEDTPNDPISEGGASETEATPLDGTEETLFGGWYIANNNISYGHTVHITGNVNIQISPGVTITIIPVSGPGITDDSDGHVLTINGTGSLEFNSDGINSIEVSKLNINGCSLNTEGNIQGREEVNINSGTVNASIIDGGAVNVLGGTVTASHIIDGIDGGVNVLGGKVSVDVIYSDKIVLGYKNADDFIKSNLYDCEKISIADGQAMGFDADHIYTGTITDKASEIKTKTLYPAYSVTIAKDIANGTVATNKNFVLANAEDKTVTLTVTPQDDFELSYFTVTDADGHTIPVTQDVNLSNAYTFTILSSNVNVTAYFKGSKAARLVGYSLSLEGDIGVNFFMDIDSSIISDAVDRKDIYVKFTFENGKATQTSYFASNNSQDIKIGGVTKTYYFFKCNIAAKDITDKIHAQLYEGSSPKSVEYTFSVEDYAKYIIEYTGSDYTTFTDEAKGLAQSMLNYGIATKNAFDGKTTETVITAADVLNALSREYDFTAPSAEEGISYYGTSLILDSKTSERHYFKVTGNKSISRVKISGMNFTDIKQWNNTNYYYVQGNPINAEKLGEDHAITVYAKDDAGVESYVFSFSYSPMHYVNSILKSYDPSDPWYGQAITLYDYWDKAATYYQSTHPINS